VQQKKKGTVWWSHPLAPARVGTHRTGTHACMGLETGPAVAFLVLDHFDQYSNLINLVSVLANQEETSKFGCLRASIISHNISWPHQIYVS
jgi:hypothetical protein